MDNSVDALRIAGGVLLSILVISLAIIGWNQIVKIKRAEADANKLKDSTEFNKIFISYDKPVVRGYELVSLANLVIDTNIKLSRDDVYGKVDVYLMLTKGPDSRKFNWKI